MPINEMELKKHISLRSNKDIFDLCVHFFRDKNLKINHLNYIKKFNDGTIFYLCSNHDWLLHYYKKSYTSIGAFERNSALTNFKYVLWNSLDSDDQILTDSRDMIGIEHGITIVDKLSDGFGFYNFATTRQTHYVNNEYINNIDALNEFIRVFKEKAGSILKEASSSRFIIPKSANQGLQIYNCPESSAAYERKERGIYLDKLLFNAHLTPRELECLNWCVDGLTIADIAVKMNISPRTAQTHIENIKSKLGCQNMFQLGYTLAKIRHLVFGHIP